MAFSSFGSPAAAAPNGVNIQVGADLEDIQTENLGFLALAGESKIQLLPTAWPTEQLPPPTASLMSIASHKGLIAAAAPDCVILASTESVRKAFDGSETGDGNVKPFQPQLKLAMPMRVSQLAFTADESYLVLSAENGGGLAVYDVEVLKNGATESTFQLATNGQSLRALVPNPTPEKGELLALVTTDGNLMMANLKERNFVSGANGQVLKSGVSCVSWSTKGKQLVAGLANGTAYQMTPEGEGKAELPRPPNVDSGDHVSSITWLENHVFLMVHTPTTFDNSQAPASTFTVVTRSPPGKPANIVYQKISDPALPYGLNRSPPHHFLLRLKDFPPNLQDALIVASTASTDIGLFSRSKTPLTNNKPADKVTGVFTMTEMTNDSQRASLPMTAALTDTSPIGFALDLSSKEKVPKPIPTDEEIAETPSPVPAMMVLNNEGVLMAWWVIYSESVRQSTAYPGLGGIGAAAQSSTGIAIPTAAPNGAFGGGGSAFGAKATFGSSGTTFGAPAFGAPSQPAPTTGAFGAPSGLGKSQSPWGTPAASTTAATSAPAFGSSTFGSTPAASTPAFGTPSFGATSTPAFGLGNRASPWASGSTAPNAAFGQAGGLNKPASAFGSPTPGTTAPASSGFASFATKGGFAAAGSPSSGGSIFGSKPATTNAFASQNTNNLFGGAKSEDTPANPFGSGASSGFVLGSTFKADPSAKDDGPIPSTESKNSLFGGAFGNALGEAAKSPPAQAPVSQEADMDSDDIVKPVEVSEAPKAESTTPATTPAAPKTGIFGTPAPASGGLFGTSNAATSTPTATPGGLFGSSKPPTSTPTAPTGTTGFSFAQPSTSTLKPGGFSFGKLGGSTDPGPKTPTPAAVPSLFRQSNTAPSPDIKPEPPSDTSGVNAKIPEAPLPPDTTSKTTFGIGESSSSSTVGDAPLPPDFITKSVPKTEPAPPPAPPSPEESEVKPIPAELIPPNDVPGGPEDEGDDESDFVTEEGESDDGNEEASEEGSGEDVTKDLSPTSETNQTQGFTPESSFGGLKNQSPDNTFMNIPRPSIPTQSRSLFGEISKDKAPILAPPKTFTSPRSPSPVRNPVPSRMLRPERVSSAPGFASQILGSRPGTARSAPSQDTFALSQEQYKQQESQRAEARARKEAEETQMLVDKDDDDLQKFLASDITGTRKLDGFQTRAEYLGIKSMDSVAAQVETVYRDINSMIDTLGLNARALQCFMKGHTEQYKDEGRTRQDLEEDDDWCLVEIENLSSVIERDLSRDLEDGRVKDVADKLETCNDLQKDLIRLRAKHEDIKKIIDSHQDPTHVALARAQPLSAEQAAQQHDLRKEYTKFQKLLSEAEEGLSVLKAKVVSQATSSGRAPSSSVPTVEAVMKTISKMTTMAEKRSGDIDVLEGQMRRLNMGSASIGSREGSPFTTPANTRSTMRNPGASLFYTPDSIKDTPQRFQSSIMSNSSSYARNSPRRKMSGYTAEEKAQLRSKMARKKEVMDKLKAALQKAGTNVRLMDDNE